MNAPAHAPSLPDASAGSRPSSSSELRWFGPDPAWKLADLPELWRYRELLLVFAGRDLKIRYRQAVIGVLWAVLQPLAMMAVFATFFGLLGDRPSASGAPYFLVAFTGLLMWQLISVPVREGTTSLVSQREMLTKVYFPPLLLPLSSVLVSAVDFCVAAALLVPLLAWGGIGPTAQVLCAPVAVVWGLIFAAAGGVWLSSLHALYRDVGHAVPFLLQIGFFVSPVVYETQAVIPERWRWVYALNPAATIIELFRWSLIGREAPALLHVMLSLLVTAALLLSGLAWFHRAERWLVDRV